MAKRTPIQIAHDHLRKAYRILSDLDEPQAGIGSIRTSVLLAEIDLGKLLPPYESDINEIYARKLKWKPAKIDGYKEGYEAKYEILASFGMTYDIEVYRNRAGKWERQRFFFEDRWDWESPTYPTRLAAATEAIRLCRANWDEPVEDDEEELTDSAPQRHPCEGTAPEDDG